MEDNTLRNDDEYVRAGGPYAELIRDLVESGRYGSAAEVVLDGLALSRDRELRRKAQTEWLRAEIQVGIDSADRGELIPADDVFAKLRARFVSAGGDSSDR